jgi:GNAT superfamily N-acetyltransferase
MSEPASGTTTRWIRDHNSLVEALYYDELATDDDYQLSLLEGDGVEPLYNCAHVLRRSDAAVLDRIEHFYNSRGLAAAVYLDPGSPANVTGTLIERGYRERPDQAQRWFTRDLHHDVPAAGARKASQNGPGDLKLETARTREQLEAFFAVGAVSGRLGEEVSKRLHLALLGGALPDGFVPLTAQVGDRAAAVAALAIRDDVAYFMESGTLPNFRRQGIYHSLLEYRLRLASDAGCKRAILVCGLEARVEGAVVKAGFELAFTRSYFQHL